MQMANIIRSVTRSVELASILLAIFSGSLIFCDTSLLPSCSSAVTCPLNCTCQTDRNGSKLMVDCVNRASENSSELNDEINDYLLSLNQSDIKLTDLTVNNALTYVPRSICQLRALKRLNLDSNQLVELPWQCFTDLSELEDFSAANNRIAELEEGVFHELEHLAKLVLANNQISLIGLNVFTARAGLRNLSHISLDNNLLSELEPWPLIRAQIMPGSNITVSGNRISQFTNRLSWGFRCGEKPLDALLSFDGNSIEHLTDITNGWNVSGLDNVVCLLMKTQRGALRLTLNNNPYNCDCRDFEILQAVRRKPKFDCLEGLVCQNPENLRDWKITEVALDEFVCNIPSPPCPDYCHCVKSPYDKTYLVTCPQADKLPEHLPDTSCPPPREAEYYLNFSKSKISTVDYRVYLNNTSTLDLSGAAVKFVTDDTWRALVNVSCILLSGNQMTTLPELLKYENITFKSIALHDNTWRCDCNDRWMRDWLISLGESLSEPDAVLCCSPPTMRGVNILLATDDQFCYDPVHHTLKIVLPTILSTSIAATIVVTLLYRFRVKAFIKFNVHPFNKDECDGEEMLYDAFVSCAREDSALARRLVDWLERRRISPRDLEYNPNENDRLIPDPVDGPRICYHQRDFVPGVLIFTNIKQAIEHSKRFICLVSSHYIRSSYCMLEFEWAWTHNLEINKRRVIVIKMPDLNLEEIGVLIPSLPSPQQHLAAGIEEVENIDERTMQEAAANMRRFLQTHTYIEYDDVSESSDWWSNLLYAMPTQTISSQ